MTVAPERPRATSSRRRATPSTPETVQAAVTPPSIDVDDLVAERERLREQARELLGVTGQDAPEPPRMRTVLKENKVGFYPLAALGTLSIVDSLQGYAFTVLTPEISRSLGIGLGTIALLLVLKTLSTALAPLPIAALVQRVPRRALVCLIGAALWALATVYTGFATSVLLLAAVLVLDGLSTGTSATLHQPLLMDSYPPTARVRAFSYYTASNNFGNVLAPLLVALLAGLLGFTWRGVFVVFGLMCVAVLPYVLKLRDPGFGRWDTERVRATVPDTGDDLDSDDVELGFFEITRRLFLIPTIKKLLAAFAVFGVLLIPFSTFLSFYLDESLNFGPGERGLFFRRHVGVVHRGADDLRQARRGHVPQ